jgi:hypothetical protein
MPRSLSDVYRDDLRFLLRLKEAVGILHNRIHDNLARTAIEHFREKYPQWEFTYTNAGAAGIDIRGHDTGAQTKLVAEVKTTLPDTNGRIRGPQINNIRKDLERLRDYDGDVVRYLVLLSPITTEAVQHQLNTDRDFPAVRLFNALDDDLREFVEPAEEE